jgi:hypothetical protein
VENPGPGEYAQPAEFGAIINYPKNNIPKTASYKIRRKSGNMSAA